MGRQEMQAAQREAWQWLDDMHKQPQHQQFALQHLTYLPFNEFGVVHELALGPADVLRRLPGLETSLICPDDAVDDSDGTLQERPRLTLQQ